MRHFTISFFICLFPSFAFANSNSPTNFQFASLPVPYPSFSVGSTDTSLGGSYQKQTAGSIELTGFGADLKLRTAPSSWLALGIQAPGSSMSGDLGADYGTLKMTLTQFAPVLNAQLQILKSSSASALIFGGYNYNYLSASISGTVSGSNLSGQVKQRTTAYPVGIQLGIPIMKNFIEFAPFYTYTKNVGGTADFTITSGGTTTHTTEKIPGFISRNYGFDLILPKNMMSIGALLQQTLAAQSNEKSMKTFTLQLAMIFGGSLGK